MRKITQEELNDILKTDGIKDLSNMDLSGLDLHDADLRSSNIRNSCLFKANLSGARLNYANICRSDLRRANLEEADLNYALLVEVNAMHTNFKNALLVSTCMCFVTVASSDFTGANLGSINEAAKINVSMACPTTGSFIGWKKSRSGLIIKLEIPEDALRSSATGRKCRASKAKCLAIENVDGSDSGCKSTTSIYDRGFRYRIGQTVTVPNFDTNRFNECAPGIHFFIDRQEAVDYDIM